MSRDELIRRLMPIVERVAREAYYHGNFYRKIRRVGELEDVVQIAYVHMIEMVDQLTNNGVSEPTVLDGLVEEILWKHLEWVAYHQRWKPVPFPKDILEIPEKDCGSEIRETVREQLDKLDDKDREILLMVYMERRRLQEVARIMGISPYWAGVRLFRAEMNLRRLLDDGKD